MENRNFDTDEILYISKRVKMESFTCFEFFARKYALF